MNSNGPFTIGVSFGRYADPLAIVVFAGNKRELDALEAHKLGALVYLQQIQITAEIIDRYPGARVIVNGIGEGDILVEELGIRVPAVRIETARITAKNRAGLIEELALLFTSGSIRPSASASLIAECEHLSGAAAVAVPLIPSGRVIAQC